MPEFTHFDESGNARMVDVGGKDVTARAASARCVVSMKQETRERIRAGAMDKGDVLGVARIAGIMAAKKTSETIPLCHLISISSVEIAYDWSDDGQLEIVATIKTNDRTGVEMEALHSAAVCGLTVYDMCKSVDREMEITSLRLESKSGGKSGTFIRGSNAHESSD